MQPACQEHRTWMVESSPLDRFSTHAPLAWFVFLSNAFFLAFFCWLLCPNASKFKQIRAEGHFFMTEDISHVYEKWKCNSLVGNFVLNNLVSYSVLFHFGHTCRWDQCAISILNSLVHSQKWVFSDQYKCNKNTIKKQWIKKCNTTLVLKSKFAKHLWTVSTVLNLHLINAIRLLSCKFS